MAKLRWGLWVVMLAAAALFAVQNGMPVLALRAFGSSTIVLPLSVWVLGAIAAGFFTSLLLQGLANVGRRQPQPLPRTPSSEREPPPEPPGSAKREDSPLDWEQPMRREWDAEPEDGWKIEEPPVEPTRVGGGGASSRTVRAEARAVPDDEGARGTREPSREPPPREARDSDRREPIRRDTVNRQPVRAPARDEVYDANFRVLYPSPSDVPDGEFDDEFDDEENWIDDDERDYR